MATATATSPTATEASPKPRANKPTRTGRKAHRAQGVPPAERDQAPAKATRLGYLDQSARLAKWWAQQLGTVEQMGADIERLAAERHETGTAAHMLFAEAQLEQALTSLRELACEMACCSPSLAPDGAESLASILDD